MQESSCLPSFRSSHCISLIAWLTQGKAPSLATEVFRTLPCIYWPSPGVFALSLKKHTVTHMTFDCALQPDKKKKKSFACQSKVYKIYIIYRSKYSFKEAMDAWSSAGLFSITPWQDTFSQTLMMVPALPSPTPIHSGSAALYPFVVYAGTAAHHHGPAWAPFNGRHRQQDKMQACQRKRPTESGTFIANVC